MKRRELQQLIWAAAAAMLNMLGSGPMCSVAAPATLFVDPQIAASSCTNYSATTRACGSGNETAFQTLAGAAAATAPGVNVLLRGGVYGEPLIIPVSGLPGQPITFKSYPAETAIITGAAFDPGINLSSRSNVVLDGLTVTNVVGWLRAEAASWNLITNCTFRKATGLGSRAGLKFIRADYNRIVNNRIEDGNDNLLLIDSDYNVVEGNILRQARHGLWSILCGNFNVIRGNSCSNHIQKGGQISDCEGVPSDSPLKYDATKYNLVDGNTFEFTASSGNASAYDGIQYSGQKGIIRRNRFYNTTGPGLALELYSDEARFVTDTRVYQNVFYGTRFAGVALPGPSSYAFSGHVFKNNIFFRSQFVANDTRWPWFTSELNGQPVQIITGRLDGFLFAGNNILGTAAGQAYAIAYGSRTSSSNPAQHPLAWWQEQHPELFTNNLEALPQFVDAGAGDFRLTDDSRLIDAGMFLTRASGGGSGTTMNVEDAGYFYDGFGIPGELGDLIQLQGQTQAVRIVHVDYPNNSLTLDQPLTWTAGQGVTLRFAGRAPDLGAFESAVAAPRLNIRREGSALFLSWPSEWAGYHLEANPLLSVSGWQSNRNPVLVGDAWMVTNRTDMASQFYRLAK
jgi:hypothetical protein